MVVTGNGTCLRTEQVGRNTVSQRDPTVLFIWNGVVAEVTLQCVDRQELVEHTVVSTMNEIKKNHK